MKNLQSNFILTMNMKTKFIIILFAINSIYSKNISVLFIGNSYTQMNNFSQMVSDIAAINGDTIIADFSAFDGYTLKKHYSDKKTIDKINSRHWDYVVMQEQSQRPILDINAFNEKTFYYADKLLQIIYDNNIETQPLLFMTWGRKNGDKNLCKQHPHTCTFEEMQNMLIDRYNLLGDMLGIPVVPCGIAWKYFILDSANHIDLFYEDGSHPSEVGSFLNAVCFYSAITGKSLNVAAYQLQNITDDEILTLQKIAFEVIEKYYNQNKNID